MIKRMFFFFATNIAIMFTIYIITSFLGLNRFVTSTGLDYPTLLGYCFVYGMVGSFISLLLSRFMAKKSMGVEVINPENPGNYSHLVHTVHDICRRANLPLPEVGVYQSPDVNAFATGFSKSSSLVAVSTGLLANMNKQEIEGVLAHEVAHIKNGDMVTLTLIQGVINAFVMFFSYVISFALNNVLRKNDDDENSSFSTGMGFHFTYMITQMVLGFLGMMVVGYFSRHREFYADSGSAKLVGSASMIAALEKLKAIHGHVPQTEEPEAIAAFKISNNFKKKSFFSISTHPELDERIEALKKNAFA